MKTYTTAQKQAAAYLVSSRLLSRELAFRLAGGVTGMAMVDSIAPTSVADFLADFVEHHGDEIRECPAVLEDYECYHAAESCPCSALPSHEDQPWQPHYQDGEREYTRQPAASLHD